MIDSNLCYTLTRSGGDVDQALREADIVVQVRVDSPRVAPIAIEPRGIAAVQGETGSLGDSALPRAGDMPPMLLDHAVTPTPLNPLGAKEVGEAGTNCCPPEIANAVIDALAPLRIQHLDMAFTVDRIWAAMHAAKK